MNRHEDLLRNTAQHRLSMQQGRGAACARHRTRTTQAAAVLDEPGGNIARDSYGKVTCEEGCHDAQAQLCEDLR